MTSVPTMTTMTPTPLAPAAATSPATPGTPEPKSSIKETITSIIIAFALAFVFRGFVIEAFLIPTGSMAPTLMGAHMRFKSPQSGYEWAVGPWYYFPGTQVPTPRQGGIQFLDGNGNPYQQRSVKVHDPMTGFEIERNGVARRWGDRIFVMKYLYSIYDPQRFDVVVFKNPRDPTVNYIKRLVGLPGEQVALVDGDVFSRKAAPGDEAAADPWTLPGWSVARKPQRAQREMWQDVFDSRYEPIAPVRDGRRWFTSPWVPSDASAWSIADRPALLRGVYDFTGTGAAALAWDAERWPILDSYAYNEKGLGGNGAYPVSDLRVSFGIRPAAPAAGASGTTSVAATITTRGHDFRGTVEGGTATLSMRPVGGEWTSLATGKLDHPLPAEKVTRIEFWHVDQQLRLLVNDEPVAAAAYDWTPAQRIERVMGRPIAEIAEAEQALVIGDNYVRPAIRLDFTGGPFTLHGVALARDIHYQAKLYDEVNDLRRPHSRAGKPAFGTHPTSTITTNGDQFFVCGDNSPESLDARLWDAPNPWVAQIDPATGVVNRDLLIGKAFFVYFPAPYKNFGVPVPDFGSMRFIR